MTTLFQKITPKAIAVAAVMTITYIIFSWYVPVAIDDFTFMSYYLDLNGGDPSFSLSVLCGYIKSVWEIENGRLANYLCAPFLLWLPHWLRAILMGATISATYLISAKFAVGNNPLTGRVVVFVWALSVVFLPWHDYSGLMIVDYFLNYFFSWLLVLLTLACIFRLEKKNFNPLQYVFVIILSVATGLIHECFSLPLMGALGCVALINRFRMKPQWWGIFIALFIGYVICMSSPAILDRLMITTTDTDKRAFLLNFLRILYHSVLLCVIVGIVAFIMLLSKSGRHRLKNILSNIQNQYFTFLSLFALCIVFVLVVTGRAAFLAITPMIIVATNGLYTESRFFRYFSAIPSGFVLLLLLAFYGPLIYWQKKIYEEHEAVYADVKRNIGKHVYHDTIITAPWYTFRYTTDGLWAVGYQYFGLSCHFHVDEDRLTVLPEVLKGADLSKCAKVEYAGDEDIYQIGDYLIVKGDVDQSRLSDDYIFYMANGKKRGSSICWRYFYDENGVKWTIGLPLRGPINGPFLRIVQPH